MTDAEYIAYNPFIDTGLEIRFRKVRIVTLHSYQICEIGRHILQPRERARYEEATINRRARLFYCCLPCIERHAVEVGSFRRPWKELPYTARKTALPGKKQYPSKYVKYATIG